MDSKSLRELEQEFTTLVKGLHPAARAKLITCINRQSPIHIRINNAKFAGQCQDSTVECVSYVDGVLRLESKSADGIYCRRYDQDGELIEDSGWKEE